MTSPARVNDFDDNKAEAAVPTVVQTAASRYYGRETLFGHISCTKPLPTFPGKCSNKLPLEHNPEK
jgi:hypothetical protein